MEHSNFEDFLADKYSQSVNCTEMDTNDDEVFERRFNDWLFKLEPDDFIKYANKFADLKMIEAVEHYSKRISRALKLEDTK